jgi:AcrR family transcriptional regulator
MREAGMPRPARADEASEAQLDKKSVRGRLLTIAARLFYEKGYDATSTRDLARALGIQSSSLYHHIDNKEDLLYALSVDSLHNIMSAAEAALNGAEGLGPTDRLRRLIVTHTTLAVSQREKHSTMLFELRGLNKKRRAEVVALRDAYQALVQTEINRGQDAGVIRTDIDPKYLTLGLLNLLNWSIVWFRPNGTLNAGELGDLLATMFLEGALSGGAEEQARNPGSEGRRYREVRQLRD